jgi:hypothetical protein
LGWVTLLLFLFSVTPKRYLHNFFAKHNDETLTVSADGQEQLCKSGFQCDCNTLVATSPFVSEEPVAAFVPPTYFSKPGTFLVLSPYFSAISYIELRGPPAIG